ncbi:MAG: hypothetical protein KF866_10200 [Phycisphaeraceae bacterium]|nr:hypothetical protein [Phycisphaeraceae bacterium]MCW5754872.1 hypothetical protein [Phycisphaeraceae bacterium]
MKLAKTFLALAFTLAPCSLAGQAAGPNDLARFSGLTQSNAALVYYRAWMVHHAAFEEYRRLMSDIEDPFDPKITAFLVANQSMLQAFLRAASIRECDWGIEYDQGFGALLPHLGNMRIICRMLQHDALRLASQDRMDEAAERAAAIFAISTHMANDRVMISALVSAAIISLGNSTVESILAAGVLTPAAKDHLLQGFARLNLADPAAFLPAVRGEAEFLAGWFKPKYASLGGGIRFLREIMPLASPAEITRSEYMQFALSGPDALADEIDRAARLVAQMAEAWRTPDGLTVIRHYTSEVEQGKHGLVAKVLVPALDRAFETESVLRAELDRVINIVERTPVQHSTEKDQQASDR